MPVTTIKNEAAWLETRKQYVGSSEVAALFDVSPYQTRFQLWQEKAGRVPPSFKSTSRMDWGQRLEAAIAWGIADQHGLIIEKCKEHYSVGKMAATPDFFITNLENVGHILEIKNVSWEQWKSKWFNDVGEIEPPINLELQVQHQMLCTGYRRASFGVLVAGSESYLIPVEPHERAMAMIEDAVRVFWETIVNNEEPEPFNASDYATVISMFGERRKPPVDLTGHAHLPELCKQFLEVKAQKSEAQDKYDLARTKIIHILKESARAHCRPYEIKLSSNNRLDVTERKA